MEGLYLWIKAAHLLSVMGWAVGMVYLPRIMARHMQVTAGSEADLLLQRMERNLLRKLMNPSMIIVFLLGIWLIIITGIGAPGTGGWIHLKLMLFLILGALHGVLAVMRKRIASGECQATSGMFHIISYVNGTLITAMVILAILKPF